jgi:hypothetical protein
MGSDFRLGNRDRCTDLANRNARKPCGALARVRKTRKKNRAVICRAAKALASPNSPVLAAIACSAIAMAR